MSSKRLLGAALATTAAAALAAATAGPAGAAVQVGSSGWQWGNPLPQGNTIRAMSFAGPSGFAAGDFGTLLKTDDAGLTWSGLRIGSFQALTTVQALDASTVVAGGGCVARRSTDGGATFTRIAFTPRESSCPQPLASLSFVDASTGWLVLADGTVQETTDGGTEFISRTAVPGTRAASGGAAPTDIAFVNATTGYAASSEGKIFQTTDAGVSWKVVSDTARRVSDITFVDALRGFAVGDAGLFLKTTDGGATWAPKDLGAANENLRSIRCATPALCVIATERGDALLRTADAGATPATRVTPSTDAIFAAAFASPDVVSAAGANGSTVISGDAGLNFSPVGGRLSGRYLGVRAGGQRGTAYAPGDNGSLARTTDGGKTWTRGNVATSEAVLDVSFPSAQLGYAIDAQGGLFKTTSGGDAWKTLDTGTTAIPNAVVATGSSVVMTIGGRGIRRSTDGGDTFSQVRGKAVARTPLTAVDRAGAALVAYGSQDLIRSTDQGKTWTAIAKPGTRRGHRNRLRIKRADFVTARTGFLLDSVGRVWRTGDGGRRWTQLPAAGTDGASGMAFSSAKAGYLVVDAFGDQQRSGFLLRTTDGGATWRPQLVIDSPIAPAGIAAPGGGADYLLGGDSALLFSTTGGDAGKPSTLTVTTRHRRLRRPAKITVTGKLSPAAGNERVTVSYQRPGSTGWQHQTVSTAANGSFTTSWPVRRGANRFVAQWAGDVRSTGDGSPLLTVTVGRR